MRGGEDMREKEGRAMSERMIIPRVKNPSRREKCKIFLKREKWERVG